MRKKTMSCCAILLACCMITGCSSGASPSAQDYLLDTASAVDSQEDENYIANLRAADDFYGYVNAKEMMETELKPTQDYVGTWSSMAEDAKKQVEDIIKEITESDEKFAPGSNEQLIHDLYWQIYNYIESGTKDPGGEDTEFIESYLNKIESVSTPEELISLWYELSADLAVSPAYYALVLNNINDSREKVLYFKFSTLADLDEIRNSNFSATVARDDLSSYLKLYGLSPDEAKSRASDIIYMYYEIAGYSDPIVLSGEKEYYETFNIFTREECSALLKNITYEQLLRSVGYDGKLPDKIAVIDPDQLVGIDSLIDNEHLREWKDLAIITLLENYSILLPDKYSLTGFEGLSPEITAITYVRKFLDKQIGEIYAKKYFNEKKRAVITKMCDDMVKEYHNLINGADWLTDEGKAYLIKKLENIHFFIGMTEPHETDPADAELIGSTLLKTAYNFERINQKKTFSEIFSDKPVNGFDTVSPATSNAFYVPTNNIIVITAAVLNKRIFDENADYAWNLGGIGSIIGHEISHAFDSIGVKFDAYGNYRPDAMPKEDIKAFKKIQDNAIAYYSSFKVLGSHVDGKLTLGENLADISGFQCVLSIAGDPESQKTVFESFANTWKMVLTDIKAKENLVSDDHSPFSVRINAVVALFDEFYEIYGVKEGDPMYIAPEDRIRRW